MGYTLILTLAMTLPVGGGHGKAANCGHCNACDACGCNGCGHHCKGAGLWGWFGLPDPCHAPGNLYQHMPYLAEPKTYYYFRPYNYTMIPVQHAEGMGLGAPAGLPYSNEMFERVYEEYAVQKPVEFVPYPPDSPEGKTTPPMPMPPTDTPMPLPPSNEPPATQPVPPPTTP